MVGQRSQESQAKARRWEPLPDDEVDRLTEEHWRKYRPGLYRQAKRDGSLQEPARREAQTVRSFWNHLRGALDPALA